MATAAAVAPAPSQTSTGELVIHNDFSQAGGDADAFRATGNHLTRFSTEGEQQIGFASPGGGPGNSSFRHLRVQQARRDVREDSVAKHRSPGCEQVGDPARYAGRCERHAREVTGQSPGFREALGQPRGDRGDMRVADQDGCHDGGRAGAKTLRRASRRPFRAGRA